MRLKLLMLAILTSAADFDCGQTPNWRDQQPMTPKQQKRYADHLRTRRYAERAGAPPPPCPLCHRPANRGHTSDCPTRRKRK